MQEHVGTIVGALGSAVAAALGFVWRASKRNAEIESTLAAQRAAIEEIRADVREIDSRLDSVSDVSAKLGSVESLLRDQSARIGRIEQLLMERSR